MGSLRRAVGAAAVIYGGVMLYNFCIVAPEAVQLHRVPELLGGSLIPLVIILFGTWLACRECKPALVAGLAAYGLFLAAVVAAYVGMGTTIYGVLAVLAAAASGIIAFAKGEQQPREQYTPTRGSRRTI